MGMGMGMVGGRAGTGAGAWGGHHSAVVDEMKADGVGADGRPHLHASSTPPPMAMYAMCDGHGGQVTAAAVVDQLPRILFEELARVATTEGDTVRVMWCLLITCSVLEYYKYEVGGYNTHTYSISALPNRRVCPYIHRHRRRRRRRRHHHRYRRCGRCSSLGRRWGVQGGAR